MLNADICYTHTHHRQTVRLIIIIFDHLVFGQMRQQPPVHIAPKLPTTIKWKNRKTF